MSRSLQIHDPDSREIAGVQAGQTALRVWNVNAAAGTGDVNIVEIAGNTITGPNLPVAITDPSSGLQVNVATEGLGTLEALTVSSPYRVDEAQGSDSLWPAGFVRVDQVAGVLPTLTPSDGDYVHARTSTKGVLYIEQVSDEGRSLFYTATGAFDIPHYALHDPTSGQHAFVNLNGEVLVSTSQVEANTAILATAVFPVGLVRDDVLGVVNAADGEWTYGRSNDRGAQWVKHDGDVTISDGGNSITVDGTVTIQEPLSIDDNSASLTVDITDPTTSAQCGVNAALGTYAHGGVRTGPDRDDPALIVDAQVYDGTPTSSVSIAVDTTNARYINVFLDITETGTPTDILITAQFSNDGGTTWFDWRIDQWTDLRYVPLQMPLKECIPLNYVCGADFRLSITTAGTSVGNTITLSAWAEVVT